ncbi:ABC-type uncharacterized transport system substrate-binding protein [Methylorubrum rhodesianum]|jgi:ABC-type uncharacterized transport system substrate-binding protein|uniref:DUF1007 family protein n=3 Tax=Methylorubrum rhodesianum TaxID=29427 RepID=A0ABU9Z8Q2_9HYPH|nr:MULTISPECIES: DUF1007 family protein [Methylorubrum]MBB5765572.1 ABC-type uncharacterized transport system substrate-binding protein [Methylorubrum rhodesianum]MBI1691913.1 DUF1007 family protein [Methylorubrum sp. DB1722]MBK3402466.1 DUF1007 family protein [Methylorubrum rhodesianum]MBY0142385.1 DUF1007 family protein [Methylorubrum populi]
MPTAATLRRLAVTAALGLAAGLAASSPASAHPHVWITAKAELAYEAGRVTGIRHAWTFDPEYTAFLTQGLDANGDGKVSPEELQGSAKEHAGNLAEFAYFTKLKVAGKEQTFAEPQEARMAMEGGKLTLSFLLPLKTPAAQGKGVAAIEIYDPTYFIAFSLAEGADALRLAGAASGCSMTVTRAKNAEPAVASAGQSMTEAMFEALTAASNYGEQFANRAIVACP